MPRTSLRDNEDGDGYEWTGIDIYTEDDLDDIDESRYIDGINAMHKKVHASDVMVEDLDTYDSIEYGTNKKTSKLFEYENCVNEEEYLINKGSTARRHARPDLSEAYRHFLESIEGEHDE